MRKSILFAFALYASLGSAQVIKDPLQAIGMNGKYVSLNVDGVEGIVLFLTDTRCPYDDHYLERMHKYAAQFTGKIQFFFVNSSAEDTPEEIRKQADAWGPTVPYLHDADQSVLRTLGGKRTSEVFLLQKSTGGLQLIYRGPLDDNPQVSEDADKNFLLDAIQAMLSGQKPAPVTARVAGCFIRSKN